MELSIRKVEIRDLKDIVSMLHDFAAFEDLSDYCEVTEERLVTAMFGPTAVAEGLIALDGEKPVGYALFFPNFSSFRGQLGMYLDDLYVSNAYRGKSLGHKMLKEIARIAASR
ncbi:MAG: GNAT family N-acetyltransferase, partial [Acidobacteriota bacterium]